MPKTTVSWNKELFDTFCSFAMLSDFHKRVLEMRIRSFTISQIAMEEHTSESNISRAVRYLQDKYDEVQPLCDKLPKRYVSQAERYMDSH